VPVIFAAAPHHRLAVDVHLTPLLLELGASVPNRGLFVLGADVERADELARPGRPDRCRCKASSAA